MAVLGEGYVRTKSFTPFVGDSYRREPDTCLCQGFDGLSSGSTERVEQRFEVVHLVQRKGQANGARRDGKGSQG